MKNVVSISSARKDLPKLIKEIQKNPETVFQISVRDETVAELRSAKTLAPPGEAVRKLIRLRQRLSYPVKAKARQPISKKVKDYLYTQES